MEYFIEFIIELFFEGGIEAVKNPKVPKYVRYPVAALVTLAFAAVIGLIIFTSILCLEEGSILVGAILLLLGLAMLIAGVLKIRKVYAETIKKKKTKH